MHSLQTRHAQPSDSPCTAFRQLRLVSESILAKLPPSCVVVVAVVVAVAAVVAFVVVAAVVVVEALPSSAIWGHRYLQSYFDNTHIYSTL